MLCHGNDTLLPVDNAVRGLVRQGGLEVIAQALLGQFSFQDRGPKTREFHQNPVLRIGQHVNKLRSPVLRHLQIHEGHPRIPLPRKIRFHHPPVKTLRQIRLRRIMLGRPGIQDPSSPHLFRPANRIGALIIRAHTLHRLGPQFPTVGRHTPAQILVEVQAVDLVVPHRSDRNQGLPPAARLLPRMPNQIHQVRHHRFRILRPETKRLVVAAFGVRVHEQNPPAGQQTRSLQRTRCQSGRCPPAHKEIVHNPRHLA